MKVTPKVTLLLRIRLKDATHSTYAKPVFAANGRIKPLYAVVGGREERHPEGVYYLRFETNGKRLWEDVGPDAAHAVTAKARREHLRPLSILDWLFRDRRLRWHPSHPG
jgi:hypothetical protein